MEMFEAPQKTYTSLANKYRPQTFEEVVGQGSVSKTLTNALKSGRVAHAYLFYGPRGCGKTTTARLLAKALNCTGHGEDKPTATPCGKCPQCIEIAASSDMDVLELDAASNTQVEKVREAIIDTVALAAGRDRFKVFILDEVHMLSASSFNALLKTIEEPPSHVVFILATTELHKVPQTIASRCQTFRFKPIAESDIASHLMDLAGAENIELDEEAAQIIAKSAGGALRDALTIFDRAIAFSAGKVDKELVSEMLGLMPRDLVSSAACAIVKNDGPALHDVFQTLQEEGYDALSLLKDLKNAFGDIFYLSLNTGAEPFPHAKDLLKESSPGFIAGLTRKISRLIDEVKFSDTPLLSAEVGLFTIMENTLDIESMIKRLEALESGSLPPPPGDDAPPAEKKTLNKEKAPAPKAQPQETPAAPRSDAQAWDAFTNALSKEYPFLYEIVQEAKTTFDGNKWTLSFKHSDSLFKDTLARRIKDLQAASKKAGAANIDFIFTAEAAGSTAAHKKPAPLPKAQSKAPAAAEIISAEEPFVDGDYSAFAAPQPTKPAVKTNKEPGEAAKRVLNIFDGHIVEAI